MERQKTREGEEGTTPKDQKRDAAKHDMPVARGSDLWRSLVGHNVKRPKKVK